jgi:hypothetical protein
MKVCTPILMASLCAGCNKPPSTANPVLTAAASGAATQSTTATAQPLPSWNDRAAKRAILDFVSRVTQEESLDFLPSAERIAAIRQRRDSVVRKPAAISGRVRV